MSRSRHLICATLFLWKLPIPPSFSAKAENPEDLSSLLTKGILDSRVRGNDGTHHKGFSLLELLFVLLVIVAITLFGLHRYRLYQRKANIAKTQQNVATLLQALASDYGAHCVTTKQHNYSPKSRIQPDDPKWKLFITPLVKNYSVNATYLKQTTSEMELPKRDIYKLAVSAELTVPLSAIAWYQQALNATSANNKTLTWDWFPSYSRPETASGLWIMRAGLGAFKATIFPVDDKQTQPCAY